MEKITSIHQLSSRFHKLRQYSVKSNVETFPIEVEDFTTASNKIFSYAFSVLIASHYVFNLLYTTQYIVYQHGISKLFEHCENILAVWSFIHCFSLFRITKGDQNNCSKQTNALLGIQALYFWRPFLLKKCMKAQVPCIPPFYARKNMVLSFYM